MVTISACALALIAFAIVGYCEYCDYKFVKSFSNSVTVDLSDTITEHASQQKLAQLSEHYQISRRDVTSFMAKCKAIIQFTHVVFFMSAEREKELVRRNELTAQQLLKEYQAFIMLPHEERVERFLQWRDDIAYFESHKQAHFSVKSDVVDVRLK